MIKNLDLGFFKTDINGIILEHNPALKKILNYQYITRWHNTCYISRGMPKVVIIDDEPSLRFVLKELFIEQFKFAAGNYFQ